MRTIQSEHIFNNNDTVNAEWKNIRSGGKESGKT
jgi:hypothetical protein